MAPAVSGKVRYTTFQSSSGLVEDEVSKVPSLKARAVAVGLLLLMAVVGAYVGLRGNQPLVQTSSVFDAFATNEHASVENLADVSWTLIEVDTKCKQNGNYRLQSGLSIGSVEECYEACRAETGCLAFSVDIGNPWCTLCNSAEADAHEPHSGGLSSHNINAYKMRGPTSGLLLLNGRAIDFSESSDPLPEMTATHVLLAQNSHVEVDSSVLASFGDGDFSIELTYQGTGTDITPDGDYGTLFIRSGERDAPYTGPSAFVSDNGDITFRMRSDDEICKAAGALVDPKSTTPRVLRFEKVAGTLTISIDGLQSCSIQTKFIAAPSLFINEPLRFGGNHVNPDSQNLAVQLSGIRLQNIRDDTTTTYTTRASVEVDGWTVSFTHTKPQELEGYTTGTKSCGLTGNFYGWAYGAGIGETTKVLTGSGTAVLTFGNCWNTGTVIAYKNDVAIASAEVGDPQAVVEFTYEDGDELSIKDEGANSVVLLTSLELVPHDERLEDIKAGCDGRRRCMVSNGGSGTETHIRQNHACPDGQHGSATVEYSCKACTSHDQCFTGAYCSTNGNCYNNWQKWCCADGDGFGGFCPGACEPGVVEDDDGFPDNGLPTWTCANGEEIYATFKCDGHKHYDTSEWPADCSDGSDEDIDTCCAEEAAKPDCAGGILCPGEDDHMDRRAYRNAKVCVNEEVRDH